MATSLPPSARSETVQVENLNSVYEAGEIADPEQMERGAHLLLGSVFIARTGVGWRDSQTLHFSNVVSPSRL